MGQQEVAAERAAAPLPHSPQYAMLASGGKLWLWSVWSGLLARMFETEDV